jgi:hypothetical protein
MALHLVGQLRDAAAADAVADEIEWHSRAAV